MSRDPDESEYLAEPEDRGDQDPLPMERATPAERKAASLPVGQIETEETLHGEVRMTRSLGLGSRNDVVHFSVALPVVVQPGWSLSQQAVAAADTAGVVKSIVYSQLGLDFSIDSEGVMHEVIKAFPGAERVRERQEEGPRTREQAREDDDRRAEERQARRDQYRDSNGGGRHPHPADLDRPQHVDRDVWQDLCENYQDWFDNRSDKASGKYKDTAPDFKRAEDGQTIWLAPFRRDNRSRQPSGRGRGYDR